MKKKIFYPNNEQDTKTLKAHALKMRREPTYCEKIIWNALRNQNLGVKFRRQFIISYYIVDFICLEKNFIIEIDGNSHHGNEAYDRKRENELKKMGYKVLRLTDEEVSGKGNKALERIICELAGL